MTGCPASITASSSGHVSAPFSGTEPQTRNSYRTDPPIPGPSHAEIGSGLWASPATGEQTRHRATSRGGSAGPGAGQAAGGGGAPTGDDSFPPGEGRPLQGGCRDHLAPGAVLVGGVRGAFLVPELLPDLLEQSAGQDAAEGAHGQADRLVSDLRGFHRCLLARRMSSSAMSVPAAASSGARLARAACRPWPALSRTGSGALSRASSPRCAAWWRACTVAAAAFARTGSGVLSCTAWAACVALSRNWVVTCVVLAATCCLTAVVFSAARVLTSVFAARASTVSPSSSRVASTCSRSSSGEGVAPSPCGLFSVIAVPSP